MGIKKISQLCKKNRIIYDLKYLFDKDQVDLRLWHQLIYNEKNRF